MLSSNFFSPCLARRLPMFRQLLWIETEFQPFSLAQGHLMGTIERKAKTLSLNESIKMRVMPFIRRRRWHRRVTSMGITRSPSLWMDRHCWQGHHWDISSHLISSFCWGPGPKGGPFQTAQEMAFTQWSPYFRKLFHIVCPSHSSFVHSPKTNETEAAKLKRSGTRA